MGRMAACSGGRTRTLTAACAAVSAERPLPPAPATVTVFRMAAKASIIAQQRTLGALADYEDQTAGGGHRF